MALPKRPALSPRAISTIHSAVDEAFDRLKLRLLGPQSFGKRMYIGGYNRHLSLPGIFEEAAREEGTVPNLATLNQILKVAGGYVDSTREKTKARVVKEVTAFLHDAHQKGVDTDLKTVLGGKLSEVWSDTAHAVRRIVDTEAQHTRNVGTLEGIVRVNAVAGIDDPTVYFVVVRDNALCGECKRLHLLKDGKTPRVWKLSEVGNGYHTKGDPNPKMDGLHPHCRCSLVTLMPGYGFNDGGFVAFIAPKHDEYEKQHEIKKSESLVKMIPEPNTAGDHEVWYHITDKPNFALDPNYAPEDNSVSIYDRGGRKGVYLTHDPEKWVNGHNYVRPYLAEFHVHPSMKTVPGIHGRYGGEMFVPAEHFDKMKLNRVIPLDAHVREEYGAPGWIEEHHGTAFDTGQPLARLGQPKSHYPFRGYKYTGPDVRTFTPEQHQQHVGRWKSFMKENRGIDLDAPPSEDE
jgi:hypothetical protein